MVTPRTVFSMKCVRHEFFDWVCMGCFRHRDERAKAIHRYGVLIFNSVTALDVLLFSFLKQVGSRGDTNPHGHRCSSSVSDQAEVRVRQAIGWIFRLPEPGLKEGKYAEQDVITWLAMLALRAPPQLPGVF